MRFLLLPRDAAPPSSSIPKAIAGMGRNPVLLDACSRYYSPRLAMLPHAVELPGFDNNPGSPTDAQVSRCFQARDLISQQVWSIHGSPGSSASHSSTSGPQYSTTTPS